MTYKPVKLTLIECRECGKQIETRFSRQVFCSRNCSIKFWGKKTVKANERGFNLSTGTVGALAELMVCCDLLRKGYEVFRAVSPSSYTDLIVIKDNEHFKLEIRTGRYNMSGTLYYPKENTDGKELIVVTHSDNKIHYISKRFKEDGKIMEVH